MHTQRHTHTEAERKRNTSESCEKGKGNKGNNTTQAKKIQKGKLQTYIRKQNVNRTQLPLSLVSDSHVTSDEFNGIKRSQRRNSKCKSDDERKSTEKHESERLTHGTRWERHANIYIVQCHNSNCVWECSVWLCVLVCGALISIMTSIYFCFIF